MSCARSRPNPRHRPFGPQWKQHITVDPRDKPLLFIIHGRGKGTFAQFKTVLKRHGAQPQPHGQCHPDTSGALTVAVRKPLPDAVITMDGFYAMELFAKAPRRGPPTRGHKEHKLSKTLRCAGNAETVQNAQAPGPFRAHLDPKPKRRNQISYMVGLNSLFRAIRVRSYCSVAAFAIILKLIARRKRSPSFPLESLEKRHYGLMTG